MNDSLMREIQILKNSKKGATFCDKHIKFKRHIFGLSNKWLQVRLFNPFQATNHATEVF